MNPLSMLGGFITGVFNMFAMGEEFNLKMDESRDNEKALRRASSDSILRGQYQGFTRRLQASQLEGQQHLAYASSGISASSKSAQATIISSQIMSELDVLTIENNAAREALGFRQQADQEVVKRERAGKRLANQMSANSIKSVFGGA